MSVDPKAVRLPMEYEYGGTTISEVVERDPDYLRLLLKFPPPKGRYRRKKDRRIRAAIEAVLFPKDVVLEEAVPPELEAVAEAGDLLPKGVIAFYRLHLKDGADLQRERIPMDWDDLSRSGKGGTYGWAKPEEAGVYELVVNSGARKFAYESQFWLLRGGKWFRIRGGTPAVVSLLNRGDGEVGVQV